MRLIDADKLYSDCFTRSGKLAISQSQIAEAPTVCGNNPKWCENCVSNGKCASTRPHGEWKETRYETPIGIIYRQTQCSNCGWKYELPMWFNFCPTCGADMRGKEEKDG